jgi:chromosome segregation ATPase
MVAPRGAASDLLDARFHVANAEAFGAATGEIQKAETELDRADRDLQTALPLVTTSLHPALNAIRKELSDAKSQLEDIEPANANAEEQIKADLDQAITSLHGERW